MENPDTLTGAADKIAAKPVEEVQSQAASRKRTTKKKDETKPGEPAKTAQVVAFQVSHEQMREVLGPLLHGLADATHTSPPVKTPEVDELDMLSKSLAYGLNHTKIATSEKTGPWVPFMLAMSMYALPRALEGLMRYLDERKRKEELQPKPASQGRGLPAGADQKSTAGAGGSVDTKAGA